MSRTYFLFLCFTVLASHALPYQTVLARLAQTGAQPSQETPQYGSCSSASSARSKPFSEGNESPCCCTSKSESCCCCSPGTTSPPGQQSDRINGNQAPHTVAIKSCTCDTGENLHSPSVFNATIKRHVPKTPTFSNNLSHFEVALTADVSKLNWFLQRFYRNRVPAMFLRNCSFRC